MSQTIPRADDATSAPTRTPSTTHIVASYHIETSLDLGEAAQIRARVR
jgi:hypothetical protein